MMAQLLNTNIHAGHHLYYNTKTLTLSDARFRRHSWPERMASVAAKNSQYSRLYLQVRLQLTASNVCPFGVEVDIKSAFQF